MPLTTVNVPTAAELSVPGALQNYVNSRLTEGWDVQLPAGIITGNISISGGTRHSSIIRGAGFQYRAHTTGTIIRPYDTNIPTVQIRNALSCSLRDFGIHHDTISGIGLSIEGSDGALVFHTKVDNVSFDKCATGIQIAEPAGTRDTQNTAADVVINHCMFSSGTYGVLVNHPQSVNIHVTGQSYFYSVDEAVRVVEGGRVLIADCCANPVGTWLRLLKAGGNLWPSIIRNCYSDRTGGAAPPIIVDARGCDGACRVLIDAFSVSSRDGDPPELDHDYFYLPDTLLEYANTSIIKIADMDFFKGLGGRTVPVNTLNPSQPPIESEVRIDRLPADQTIGKANGTQLSFPSDGVLRVSNAAGTQFTDITAS